MSEFRISRRNGRPERSENESENVVDLPPIPPSRIPFSDYNQNARSGLEHDQDTKLGKIGVSETGNYLVDGLPLANKGSGLSLTPGSCRGKPQFDPNSAPSTPVRSVGRLSSGSFAGGARNNPQSGSKGGNLLKTPRGISSCTPASLGMELPHFALEEDGSFWVDHNVQVLIRIRPISKMEKELHGYSRCLKQESANTVTWLGNPETRFTFDHIAGETIMQDVLFKVAGLPMVENCMSGYNSCMFAYGQTGSGKTYTMMGELHDADNELSEDHGMTPRIFEYLFARIKSEESNRKDEKLKYSCKCSFLEIYNEQITDLLEPSSTNLQLREDLKKGVYVENLREFEVETVKDVVDLLFQGTANRKVAATSMNSESSRSHSVFTCVIESRWEKDAMTHFRFARLNLVDLAGSERQKSSGAEGERLKEAANINKSLSTLGLVIMTLVDVAHGKHRHIPYRDSRLTFLLQDSLGGNSKTTIIANVSPSISCAHETLSTLKFAQRAKLIQNNAKVNEDASGDVMALQRQIQILKDQLTFLEHQNVRSLSFHSSSFCYDKVNGLNDSYGGSPIGDPMHESNPINGSSSLRIHDISNKKLKKLEAMLVGSLRREKMAETTVMQLKAEIEQMNRLCNQREEDSQRTKAIIRLRDEKIRRLELLAGSLQPADEFLMEENIALREEIQLLQAKIDRNPELTRFALENIRLLEQLRMIQDFHEKGEKEMLLAEVSELRNQLLEVFERRDAQNRMDMEFTTVSQENESLKLKVCGTLQELEDIKKSIAVGFEANTRLAREVDELLILMKEKVNRREPVIQVVGNPKAADKDKMGVSGNDGRQVSEKCIKTATKSERMNFYKENIPHENDQKDYKVMMLSSEFEELLNTKEEAWSLLEILEAQQTLLANDMDDLRQENNLHLDVSSVRACNDMFSSSPTQSFFENAEICSEKLSSMYKENECILECGNEQKLCPVSIENMGDIFQDVQKLKSCQSDQASQASDVHDMKHACKILPGADQTVLNTQEQLAALEQEIESKNDTESTRRKTLMLLRTENEELQNKLSLVTQENVRLTKALEDKEADLMSLAEWEKQANNLTSSLMNGYHALEEASDQVGSILNLFPERTQLDERMEVAEMAVHEKEKVILDLQRRLERAQKMGNRTKSELSSLKEAIMAISDVQLLENVEKCNEVENFRNLLHNKMCTIKTLEDKIKHQQDKLVEANKRANASFLLASWLLSLNTLQHKNEESAYSSKHIMDRPCKNISNWTQSSEIFEAVFYIQSMHEHAESLDKEVEELKLALSHKNLQIGEGQKSEAYAEEQEGNKFQMELGCQKYRSLQDLISFSYEDIEETLSSLVCDIVDMLSITKKSVQDLMKDAWDIKGLLRELTDCNINVLSLVKMRSLHQSFCGAKLKNLFAMSEFPQNELGVIHEKLCELRASVEALHCRFLSSKELSDLEKQVRIQPNCCLGIDSSDKTNHSNCFNDDYSIKNLVTAVSTVSSMEPCTSNAEHVSCKHSSNELTWINFDSKKENDKLSAKSPCNPSSLIMHDQNFSLIPQIECFHGDHSRDDFNLDGDRPNCQITVDIRKELESALFTLKELLLSFNKLYNENNRKGFIMLDRTENGNFISIENEHTIGSNRQQTEHGFFETECFLPQSDQRMGRKEGFYCEKSELSNVELGCATHSPCEKSNETQMLLLKFGEAQETMKEADAVLNALVEAYETAKHETGRWKKVGQDLMVEKAALIQQVQELKDSIHVKEQEYVNLQDHFQVFMSEANDSLSLFENSFIHIKKSFHEFNLINSDFSTFIREFLVSINILKSWPENLLSMILENGFALSVLSHCLFDFSLHKTVLPTADSGCFYHSNFQANGIVGDFGEAGRSLENDQIIEGINGIEKVVTKGCSEFKFHLLDSMDELNMAENVQNSSHGNSIEVDVMHCANHNLSSSQRQCLTRTVELENEKAAIVQDVQLIKEIINYLIIYLDNVGQVLASPENIPNNEKLADDAVMGQLVDTNRGVSADLFCCGIAGDVKQSFLEDQSWKSSTQAKNKSPGCQVDDVVLDEALFLADFQSLRNQCAELLEMLCERRDDTHNCSQWRSSTVKQGQDSENLSSGRFPGFSNYPISSELCGPLVQALINLGAKLNLLADKTFFGKPSLDGISYKLEKFFENICNVERKTYMYQAKLSELDKQKAKLVSENLLLSRGLSRKDFVIEGLLFDLKLLQESKSNANDRKDEAEEMSTALRKTRKELAIKAANIDGILARQQRIEEYLTNKETAIAYLQSELTETQEALEMMSNENAELKILLDDLYLKKHDFEEKLLEQQEVVESLKKEIVHISSTVEQNIINSIKDAEDQLHRVIAERDLLRTEVAAISSQLEAALALADENEAMAIEAQQASEASKIHADQKEVEARVLEQSVEELEHTIDLLEKKVYEMSIEVERQKLIKEELELEMQDLRLRVLKTHNVQGSFNAENSIYQEEGKDNIISRHMEEIRLELLEAKQYICVLQKEKETQAEQIMKYQTYVAELVLHSEAQACQYQEKYKALEAMACDAQHCIPVAALAANRTEKTSVRTRGSGSPFKCITSLVNQMNSEKEQELYVARLHMEELEALAASRQKEVCTLNARLAVAESMTHDVIRDLLGVKLDLTTYASLLDQQVIQQLANMAQQQREETRSKEQEILMLKKQLDDLIEERARLIEENNQKKSEVLDSQLKVEQVKRRQQLLTAQNELLQTDKQNLKRKIEELDEALKCFSSSQESQQPVHHHSKSKENRPLRACNDELDRRLKISEKLLSHVKDELAQYRIGRNGKAPAFGVEQQRRM